MDMICDSILSAFMKRVKDVEEAYNASGHIFIVDNVGSGIETTERYLHGRRGRTEDGNQIIFAMSKEIAFSLKQNTFVLQFDALFALTWSLYANDEWFYKNEFWEKKGPLEKALNQLAQAWKKVLSKSDAALDIDSAFTRPGVEALLDLFAAKVSDNGANSSYEFNWRPDNYPESGFIGSSEGHLGKRLSTRLEPRKITKLAVNSSSSSGTSSKKQKIAEDDTVKDETEVKEENDIGTAEAIMVETGSTAGLETVSEPVAAMVTEINGDNEKGVAEAK